MTKKHKVTVGIVSFKDTKYLKHALPTLLNQSYQNFEILVCDNNPSLETTKWLKKNHPKIRVLNAGGNVGFGVAHNKMIYETIQSNSKFYLAFNSDIFASTNLIENLVNNFTKQQKKSSKPIAAINPKLLRWSNFPNDPKLLSKNIIDTTGIKASPRHYFEERGNGQPDNHQFKEKLEVWGMSGALPLININALQAVQHSPTEFFDSKFFMYKEDVDISYRFRWAGYKILYCPEAEAWHDRTGTNPGNPIKQILARRNRPQYIQEQSFLNHIQLLQKNWAKDYSLYIKFCTLYELSKVFIYLAIFNRKVLQKYKSIPKTVKKTNKKLPTKQMQKYLSNNFSE